jgi:hypothetical protein
LFSVAAFWLVMVSTSFPLQGAETTQDEGFTYTMGEDSRVNITTAIEWLLDPGGALTLEEARSPARAVNYQRIAQPYLALGPMHGAVWARISLHNRGIAEDFVLEVTNPRLPEVDFHILNGGSLEKLTAAGVSRPFSARDFRVLSPTAKLHVPHGETRTLYLRAHNTGEMRFQLVLWQRDAFANHASTAHNGELIMTGILLCMAAFYLALFLSMREDVYLHLSLFLFAWTLFYMAMTALGSMLLWSDAPVLANRAPTLFTFLMCATFLLFTHSLSGVKEHSPRLSRVCLFVVCIAVAGMVHALVFDNIGRIYAMLAISAITPVLAFFMAFRGAMRGNESARLFLICWCLFHLGGLFLVGLAAYLRSPSAFATTQLNAVVVLSIFTWSLDLTARIKGRERQQKRLLETRVEERTRELREALERVKTLSGLLPICAGCKKIRDDQGYWNSVEGYLKERVDVDFTHGICPDCKERLYGEYLNEERASDAS